MIKAIFAIFVIFTLYTCTQIPSFQSYKDKAQLQKTALQNVALTAKGQKIKNNHQTWSNDVCNAVAAKEIIIGMSDEQVKASWGEPHKINSTVTAAGTHEQWVMNDSINSSYVYFTNGIMTSLQQSK